MVCHTSTATFGGTNLLTRDFQPHNEPAPFQAAVSESESMYLLRLSQHGPFHSNAVHTNSYIPRSITRNRIPGAAPCTASVFQVDFAVQDESPRAPG
eukprot:2857991-Rhodomonas_salina.1